VKVIGFSGTVVYCLPETDKIISSRHHEMFIYGNSENANRVVSFTTVACGCSIMPHCASCPFVCSVHGLPKRKSKA